MLDNVVIENELEVLYAGLDVLDCTDLEELSAYGITTAAEMLNVLIELGNDETEPTKAEEARQVVRDLVKGPHFHGTQVGPPSISIKPEPRPAPAPALTTDTGRRCAEPGCGSPSMPRKGERGPHPKRCEPCTEARERAQRAGHVKPREEYPPCCVEAGNALCAQHEQQRDYNRDFNSLPDDVEVDALDALMGEEMWHLDCRPFKFSSGTGPDEGRTANLRKRHAEELHDEAAEWIAANPNWWL